MSQAAEDRADLELFLDEARRFVHNRLQLAPLCTRRRQLQRNRHRPGHATAKKAPGALPPTWS
ncbi:MULTISPECIES: hypothetical protein [Marinobacter]|uniref:hypothetical protein n=1 Tax=Marinobacter TaxID=2742 RepID=UPI001CD70E58|nr:hypothetical protein [Marinobacter nauticus]MCA0914314.1 hypothetical protein [Marinobacter nauticus]